VGGSCSGSCEAELGVYLDGQAVPKTRQLVHGLTTGTIACPSLAVSEGATVEIPAGSHTVAIGITKGAGVTDVSTCDPHFNVSGPFDYTVIP
jgi:hypothetical protein